MKNYDTTGKSSFGFLCFKTYVPKMVTAFKYLSTALQHHYQKRQQRRIDPLLSKNMCFHFMNSSLKFKYLFIVKISITVFAYVQFNYYLAVIGTETNFTHQNKYESVKFHKANAL